MNCAKVVNLDAIKLVSWDVDGTLYSFGRMKWQLLCLLLQDVARGRGLVARKEWAALRLYRARINAARDAGGALDDSIKEVCRERLQKIEKRWYGRALERAGPRAGVIDVLAFFAAKNVPQVVLSDYYAAYKLDALGLKDRFAAVYAGEHLGFVKPSPKGFERVAADFGIPTKSILHIGDRHDVDGAGGSRAGCQPLILGRDFRSFNSLLRQLRSMR